MATKPLISIITPSYNQGQFIEETIQSVLGQDYPHIEYLILDGGSTDETLTVLEKYNLQPRLTWWSEKDDGQADALRKGFARCQGDILCWLNSDDIYLTPTVLSQVVALFQQYPTVNVVTGGGVEISATGQWMRQINTRPHYSHYQRLKWVDHMLQPATFFRRGLLDTVTIDPTLHYAFDWDLFIQMAKKHNMFAINALWAGYRHWGQNKTAAGGLARVQELREVTGRYGGWRSWQAIVLGGYCHLFRMAAYCPKPIQARWVRAIKTASYTLQVLTNHRITSI